MHRIYFSLIIAVCILTSLKREKGFVITGTITGIPDSTQLMLRNISSAEVIDSAIVLHNKFRFSGILADSPEELRIISGAEELKKGKLFYTDLLIGNETVQVNGDVSDMPLNISTTGSPSQQEAEAYNKQWHKWNSRLKQLKADLQSFPDSVDSPEKTQAIARVNAMKDSLESWKTSFIKTHFNSYIALVLYNYNRDLPVDTLRKLYAGLSPALKQSKYGKSINTQINYPKPQAGAGYHNFEATSATGDPFSLSSIKNKYILLQFAGTGCYWSHQSMPEIKSLSREYKDAVTFVSYFMDNKTDWISTVRKDSIEWQTIWSEGFKYSDACNKYSVTGTPTFFLISPDKKIISTWFGYEKGIVEKEIEKALSKAK